jgi:uncharacterized protein
MLWKSLSPAYEEIRAQIDLIPVIETHEHWTGICQLEQDLDILRMLANGSYYASDLQSASGDYGAQTSCGMFPSGPLGDFLADLTQSFDARYDVWRCYHDRTCHTAYSKSLLEGMRICWGLQSIEKNDLLEVQAQMRMKRDQKYADRMLAEQGIRAMVADVGLTQVMNEQLPYRADLARFVLDLPQYHAVNCEAHLRKLHLETLLGRKIVILDDYLEAFERYLQRGIEFGIVGIKDQSAYHRCIHYENPDRGQAESIFNRVIANPRATYGTEEVRPLDDYLFNCFLRLAARYSLPVQVHTGHMAGIRNEIQKTNPAHLTSMLELHGDVVFDLFHGGWPYLGEFLFLGKNYPNVNLDMCWANEIDPLYSAEFYRRAVQTVPHSKISAFGGDTWLFEAQVGSLTLARDNVAIGLTDLVSSGWLGREDALEIARAVFFHNPNRLFNLQLSYQT